MFKRYCILILLLGFIIGTACMAPPPRDPGPRVCEIEQEQYIEGGLGPAHLGWGGRQKAKYRPEPTSQPAVEPKKDQEGEGEEGQGEGDGGEQGEQPPAMQMPSAETQYSVYVRVRVPFAADTRLIDPESIRISLSERREIGDPSIEEVSRSEPPAPYLGKDEPAYPEEAVSFTGNVEGIIAFLRDQGIKEMEGQLVGLLLEYLDDDMLDQLAEQGVEIYSLPEADPASASEGMYPYRGEDPPYGSIVADDHDDCPTPAVIVFY